MLTLFHGSFEPIIYGIIIFLGLYSMWWKFTRGKILAGLVEVFVFWLVFKLHGGSVTGGFAATVASLLAGLIIPITLPRRN